MRSWWKSYGKVDVIGLNSVHDRLAYTCTVVGAIPINVKSRRLKQAHFLGNGSTQIDVVLSSKVDAVATVG